MKAKSLKRDDKISKLNKYFYKYCYFFSLELVSKRARIEIIFVNDYSATTR